jgi:hypothetical protein
MEITPRELKKIERLRKLERQWPRYRWIMLVVGIVVNAGYMGLLIFYFHEFFPAETNSSKFREFDFSVAIFVFALIWPKVLLGFCFGSWYIIVAIRDWHGNINRILLLKLLDAQQSTSATSAKTS